MKVKLISYSQSPIVFNRKTLEDQIAYCARVSNPDNQDKKGGSLLKYLVDNQHWSPFEMVSACLEIETTRDIARQILRHRSFSFQEFSQRYADPTIELDFEYRQARLQDLNNRQNSTMNQDIDLEAEWTSRQQRLIELADDTYTWARRKGIAKEQARCVLPEGNTTSRLYMNGTLRSWIHYIDLRSANGTQLEHREIAVACRNTLAKVFPLIEKLT
jgi:thymidylate synthase (FAD)